MANDKPKTKDVAELAAEVAVLQAKVKTIEARLANSEDRISQMWRAFTQQTPTPK